MPSLPLYLPLNPHYCRHSSASHRITCSSLSCILRLLTMTTSFTWHNLLPPKLFRRRTFWLKALKFYSSFYSISKDTKNSITLTKLMIILCKAIVYCILKFFMVKKEKNSFLLLLQKYLWCELISKVLWL